MHERLFQPDASACRGWSSIEIAWVPRGSASASEVISRAGSGRLSADSTTISAAAGYTIGLCRVQPQLLSGCICPEQKNRDAPHCCPIEELMRS